MEPSQKTRFQRFKYTESDGARVPYTAIDPANEVARCTCGNPDCVIGRMLPFREHIAQLFRALNTCTQYRTLPDEWQAICYPLQMAASIEDIFADTGFVDDSGSIMYCRGAYDYERAQSEMASMYVAALSIFGFIWNAYEAVVTNSAPHLLRRLNKEGRQGERGRRLLEEPAYAKVDIRGLQRCCKIAEMYCERGGLFEDRLAKIRRTFPNRDAVFCAELVREFRNHIFHGEDSPPEHDAWGSSEKPGKGVARIRRFYAVSRLVLFLIQSHSINAVIDDESDMEFGYDEECEPLVVRPRDLLIALHLTPSNCTAV